MEGGGNVVLVRGQHEGKGAYFYALVNRRKNYYSNWSEVRTLEARSAQNQKKKNSNHDNQSEEEEYIIINAGNKQINAVLFQKPTYPGLLIY